MSVNLGAISHGINIGCAGFQETVGDNAPVDCNTTVLGQTRTRSHTHSREDDIGGNGVAIVEADEDARLSFVDCRHQWPEMECRTLRFQCCLHCLTSRLRQQSGQTVTEGVHCFHLETTIDQIIGVLATYEPASNDAHLLHIILGDRRTEISVIQQVVHGVHPFQPITLNWGPDHLGAYRQHQFAIVDRGIGVGNLDQLASCINLVDPGHGPHTRLELPGHLAGIRLDQIVGRLAPGITGGEHRLGVGASVVGGNQDERRFAIVLAKLLGQPVSRQTRAQNNNRRMLLVDHRLLVVGHIVHR